MRGDKGDPVQSLDDVRAYFAAHQELTGWKMPPELEVEVDDLLRLNGFDPDNLPQPKVRGQ